MSKITAQVSRIQTYENINIVSFTSENTELKMMSLDISSSIKLGTSVLLNVKPTAIAIGKNLSGQLSYANKIDAKIESINKGELLCSLFLSFGENTIESIITLESAQDMKLKKGDGVIALIKANELSISEVLV